MIGRRKGGIWERAGAAPSRPADRSRAPRGRGAGSGRPGQGLARALAALARRARARARGTARPPLARDRRTGPPSEGAPRDRRGSPWAVAGLLLAALAAGAALAPRALDALGRALRTDRFAVRAVAVSGAHRLLPREIARATGVAPGTPLLDVDVAALEARVAALPGVAEARALRLPPGRVLVSVVEHQAHAVVAAGELGRLHVVCPEGVPFAVATPRERAVLPRIVRATPAVPGKPDAGLAEAVALSSALRRAGFAAPASLALGPEGEPARVRLRGLAADVLFDRGAPEDGVSRLVRLVAERPDLVRGATAIDLRFAGQAVLRSAEAAPGGADHAAARRGNAPSPTPPRTG